MKNRTLALATLAAFTFAVPAFAADEPKAKVESTFKATDNGGYEKTDTSTSTDSNGTTVSHEATKKVDVGSDGNTETSVDIKDKTKPDGLFSKSSTTEVHNKAVKKDGKVKIKHVKKVNGTTVEDKEEMQQPAE
ncbi:MAG: hypothetical protein P4M15_07380 [Alphaproteobacteria bacterium]|nr:hypothetical protein [Alphaproteobacteria bacterium]